jgi:transcriptional regulator with XRE-family HTH domain
MLRRGAKVLQSIDEHVGRRVHVRRRHVMMTQKQLGARVGVAYQQIQKYEIGESRISAGRLWLLSKALEVPVSYFYEGLD